jgi:hypothetical protein
MFASELLRPRVLSLVDLSTFLLVMRHMLDPFRYVLAHLSRERMQQFPYLRAQLEQVTAFPLIFVLGILLQICPVVVIS